MKTIDTPRTEMKPHAPKMLSLEIPKDFIGAVIGPGGKVIQALQAETETTITIEEDGDVGKVSVSGTDQEKLDMAIGRIKAIAFVPTVGEVYKGIVKAIQPYGAFVEIGHNTQGLLHVSEIDWNRIEKVELSNAPVSPEDQDLGEPIPSIVLPDPLGSKGSEQ